jgi:hypothetical protein
MNDVQQDKPDADGLVRCFEQATPARQLPNLRGIPTLILMSEASYYGHTTTARSNISSRQASMRATTVAAFIRLAMIRIMLRRLAANASP